MAKGENIYKRKDGRWEGRYKKGYDQNRKIRYGYCYGHSYRETKEKLNRAKAEYLLSPSSRTTFRTCRQNFGTYCEQWLKIHENRLKKSTIAKYNMILENHIYPGLGGYPVTELTSDRMAEFSNELLAQKHLSTKTVRDILTFVHEVIAYAQSELGHSLPITISYPQMEHKELRVLSMEEQQRLTTHLLQNLDPYKLAVLLALFTGLRIGEICALKWKSVSFDSGFLEVQHTVQRIRNPDRNAENKTMLLLGTPKTVSSVRTIPLTDTLLELLERFHTNVTTAESFVITGKEQLIDPRKLQRKLKEYTTALELSDVHFHTLRHTFATRCVEFGCDTKTLSELLGHANVSTTMNRYVHPSLEFKRQNMLKLEQAVFFTPSNAPSEKSTEKEILS